MLLALLSLELVLPLVERSEVLLIDLLEELLWEQAQQVPAEVERPEDIARVVGALAEELSLELLEELKEELVIVGEGFLTHDGLHGHGIFTLRVEGVELVGYLRVVHSSKALADSALHETREGREHVDWWVDLSVVQLAINEDLALGDVASQVGDGMGDIIIGHGQDGQLSDGAVLAVHTACALIDCREIRVHVTGVSTTPWHLLSGGRDLTEGIGVGAHICENREHVHLFLISEVLSGGQSQAGSDDTLNGGVVCQVHEEHDAVHRPIDLEVGLEETSGLHVDSHGCEHNGEIVIRVVHHVLLLHEGGLSANLSTDLIVGQTGRREERDLLAAGDGVHHIDGRDARLDHLLGVDSLIRVNRLALY